MKKRITVLALAFAMVLTMSASVFATEAELGDNYTAKAAALTKELDVAEGIAVPTEAFSFAVVKAPAGNPYVNDVDYVSNTDQYADVAFANISFSEEDRDTTTPEVLVRESTVDLTNAKFDRAGLFVYSIKENAGTTTGMTYDSEKTYYLKVYVKNSDNGPVVDQVAVTDGSEKKDATPQASEPGNNQPVDSSKEGNGQFRFVNKYVEEVTKNPETTDDEGKPTADGAFTLEKIVTGDYGDKTKEFAFAITVKLPTTAADDYALSAAVGETAVSFSGEGKTKTASVNLKDSDVLKFASLPAGTKITFAETKEDHYNQSYEGKHDKDAAAVSQADSATQVAAKEVIVGSKGAYINYTNAFQDQDVTPTGIIINNLPYVLLIGLALGGIVLFSRKRRYE